MNRPFGIATLFLSLALTACGGGAQTTANPAAPPIGNTGDTPYTGPVARDADVLKFQQEFWSNARTSDRCGSCHTPEGGQAPYFVRSDNINLAYDDATTRIDRDQPSASAFVSKVSSPPTGHNCWVDDPGTCAAIMTNWIENWIGYAGGGAREIVLTAPPDKDPGDSKNFPDSAALFQQWLYDPILAKYCSNCHSSGGSTPQQPYFADQNIDVAYEAAKSKINLDTPEDSRFVIKVSRILPAGVTPVPGVIYGEAHNCWDNDCPTASDEMLAAINGFAGNIDPTTVDADLVTSKAVTLLDGTLASGGNRYENDQIALWEFKTGNGGVAYDTSGVDPAIDLNFSGDVTWFGGWGISIGSDTSVGAGKAQASTVTSKKLHDVLVESGEFSIEAWVVPANVTQEMARIVSYSMGRDSRNFSLQQTLYNYDFLLRTNAQDTNGESLTDLNGNPQLSTPDADEVLQATLQHVVATYNPIDGRRIYVNGVLETQTDPIPGGTLGPWQNNMAFILGNEASSDHLWEGTFRLAAIHDRALTEAQINQNFDAGVGERFYLLFDISERIGAPVQTSYILFVAQQFDTYSYLFDMPHFTTLDGSTPQPVSMKGLRIAMNGQEAPVGQSYSNLDDTLDLATAQLDELGQPLSVLGAVLPLEKGPEDDEFFLTFDDLNGTVFNRPEDPMLVVTPPIAALDERTSDIGIKTFDEIDASYAAITGVNRTTYQRGGIFLVEETYQELRQSLPAIEDIQTFLSSHQVAIAQLAIQYCDAAVEEATIWPTFDFNAAPGTAFAVANRDDFVEPLIARTVGHSSTSAPILTQPSYAIVHDEMASYLSGGIGLRPDNLIDRLLAGPSDTRAISKGVCASVLGSAATLVQ